MDRHSRAVAACLAACTLALSAAACNGEAEARLDLDRVEAGRTVYQTNCARCHQENGEGFAAVYPSLAGNPIVTLHDPQPAARVIANGRGGMPGFRHSLDAEERAQVLSYIRQAWGNNASSVLPTEVR